MKTKALILACFFLMGLMFITPQEAEAAEINSDVVILFVNQTDSFATVVVREISTNTQIELRLAETHPNKNAITAILLTALSLDEVVRIRWETGTPPLLKRVAINRL